MQFKAFMDVGEPNVHTNALAFDTVEEAAACASDFYGRWLLVRRWFVLADTGESHVPTWRAELEQLAQGPA
jgi:hypothetical protein